MHPLALGNQVRRSKTCHKLKGYLNQVPVPGSFGDLVGDRAASGAKEDQLLRVQVDHVEEGLQAHSGVTL